VQHHAGLFAQVVEDRRGLLEEQRQVVLDAGGGDAVAHVLVDAALGRVALQQLAPAAAKARRGVVVHRELAAGQQAHLGHRVQAALRVGSKVRIESTSSSNRSTRKGTGEPIGNRSIRPPRTAYSPGLTTWVTWL
jgi:hypothetical protein